MNRTSSRFGPSWHWMSCQLINVMESRDERTRADVLSVGRMTAWRATLESLIFFIYFFIFICIFSKGSSIILIKYHTRRQADPTSYDPKLQLLSSVSVIPFHLSCILLPFGIAPDSSASLYSDPLSRTATWNLGSHHKSRAGKLWEDYRPVMSLEFLYNAMYPLYS